MGIAQKEMAELGPVGILRESLQIYRGNAATLVWIQLTMGIPAMISIPACKYFIDFAVENLLKAHPPAGPRTIFLLLICSIVILHLTFAVFMVSIAAIFYIVGCSYTGKGVSFAEILQALPRLWPRLMITGRFGFLVASAIICISLFSDHAISKTVFPNSFLMFALVIILSTAVFAFSFYFGSIFHVANGVTVLEEDYGWSAIAKASELLGGKWSAASAVLVIYALLAAALAFNFSYELLHWKEFGRDTRMPRVAAGMSILLLNSVLWIMGTLCGGVLYVSCKAYHHESIVLYISLNSDYVERLDQKLANSRDNPDAKDRGGYQAIGSPRVAHPSQ